ncbi:MAG: RNA pseudouridine synthase [Candidatus Aminicenantes bacterium]|nr:MAG: RNA pseudouridine synthase [Candidatus Aminicenantes bacterium]
MTGSQAIKKFFITAKSDIILRQLLENHLPPQYNAEVAITSGGVWKGKQRVMDPDTIIHAQETLKIHISTFQGKIYTLPQEHIIFENPEFMVVYKPCNLNVHSVPSTFYYNLAYGVNQYLQQQGIDFQAAPVTRLDRPVEGLVIFPKNKSGERQLFKLVKHRKVKKWYMAALEKSSGPRCLRIRDKLSNYGNRTVIDENGKDADSLFIKTQSLEFADIYSVFIFTGRRHQVRFHSYHYIAPIIGDRFYGSSTTLKPDDIALVCRGYNIPLGREMFKIRLPQYYLDKFFEKIKHASGIQGARALRIAHGV